eukprot:SAG31_NODE_9769_length_1230_cov_1.557029_2_plen_288_part_00
MPAAPPFEAGELEEWKVHRSTALARPEGRPTPEVKAKLDAKKAFLLAVCKRTAVNLSQKISLKTSLKKSLSKNLSKNLSQNISLKKSLKKSLSQKISLSKNLSQKVSLKKTLSKNLSQKISLEKSLRSPRSELRASWKGPSRPLSMGATTATTTRTCAGQRRRNLRHRQIYPRPTYGSAAPSQRRLRTSSVRTRSAFSTSTAETHAYRNADRDQRRPAGVTGAIGSGKSTAAAMVARLLAAGTPLEGDPVRCPAAAQNLGRQLPCTSIYASIYDTIIYDTIIYDINM